MTFLAPLFLLALAALAVPVLIHLTHRERHTVVVFPSLMFLRKIPYESVRRRRIRDWLLLALRAAALALIIAAFARPFVRGSELSASAGGAREIVVLLDRSYSMAAGDSWTRAREALRQALATVGPSDRVSLVLFSSTAELALRSSADASRVITDVDALQPGTGGTRYAPALKLAAGVLAESSLPRREVVLISDFQRAGWQPDEALRLPGAATLTPMPVEPGPRPNLSVTPLSVQRVRTENQERVVVTAGVVNRGEEPASNVRVDLDIDGRTVQSQPVNVAPASSAATTFAPVTIAGTAMRLTTRIPDDALAADNAFHAIVAPPQSVATMIVGAGGRGDADLYLLRALGIGDRPRFTATTHQIEALTADALSRTRVVVLQDLALSEQVAARLRTFVEGGGGLVVALGPRSSWPASAAWLPVTITGTEDRTRGSAAKLSGFDYGHAVFEPFRAPRSGDFSSTRIYGHRVVTPSQGSVTIARFDGGLPALVEQTVGRGRVLVWATSLDLSWSDLPLKPVYLPFVHQLVRRGSDYREEPGWLTIGQAIDLAAAGAGAGAFALAPGGQRRTPVEGSTAIELTEAGFYEVRDQSRDGPATRIVASNVDLAEADLSRVDPAEMALALTGRPGDTGPDGTPTVLPDSVQEQSQRVWWYLLFAGILLLIAETWVARRLVPAA